MQARAKRREVPTVRLAHVSREAIALYRAFRDFHRAVAAIAADFGTAGPEQDLAALRDAIDLAVPALTAPENALSEASYLSQNEERLSKMRGYSRRRRLVELGTIRPEDGSMPALPNEPIPSFDEFIAANADLYKEVPEEDWLPPSEPTKKATR